MSLLELLLGLVLAPIILAGIHSSYRAQLYALAAHNTSFGLQDDARGALDLIVREVRMAGYDPTGAALPVSPGPACPGVTRGITEATATRLRILADLDGDGGTTGPGEDVIYQLDTAIDRVLRTDGLGTEVLADNMATNGLTFRYFDLSDPPLELAPAPSLTADQLDCVGTVSVLLQLTRSNPDPSVTTDLESDASSQVAIRSRALTNF